MSQQNALPGMAAPKQPKPTTVYLEVDGEPHPATDCHWIEIAKCGCIAGVSRAGYRVGRSGKMEIRHTGEDAFNDDRPKAVVEYERKTYGSTYKLITNQQYRDTYMEQMKGSCPHTPSWGIEPLPTPEGWSWKTTDGSSDRNSFRQHLVSVTVVGGTDMDKVTSLCGKVATRWRWNGERHSVRDTVPCSKCLKLAPSAPVSDAAPAVVDVPTGDLL